MEGREMDRPDPSRLRVSDEDRHKVAEVLRQAAGEGRIDLDELDERLEATYSAKTYGDLVPITADLPVRTTGSLPAPPPSAPPAVRPAASQPAVPAATYESSMSFMGDCSRRGVWRVPEQHTAFSMMGSVTLDLREAVFGAQEVTINAVAIMAGIDIIVNPWTQVIVDGVGIMGDFSQSRDKAPAELTAGSPVVRVKGLALMAGVNVQRKPMPGEPRKRLGRGS
ncbi:MAG TPA: DUF1707 domain-containing protein [Nocardioidaceae bacterium]|nr:DUF1707 domain-containing protein [Nocardioidaceae bacterium]